jgi:hypothetical protein
MRPTPLAHSVSRKWTYALSMPSNKLTNAPMDYEGSIG